MGSDLKILPQRDKDCDYSHDVINLDRDPDLFELISKLEDEKGIDVPTKGIKCFARDSYDTVIKTDWGGIIKGVPAHELKKALFDYESDSWRNRAFFAFLNRLPNDLTIWIYWC